MTNGPASSSVYSFNHTRLKIKRNETDISCTRNGLIRLGVIAKPHLRTAPDAAYAEGVNQFKIDLDVFRGWFETEESLGNNALVALQAARIPSPSAGSERKARCDLQLARRLR